MIIPYGDKILVEVIQADAISQGGIIIPDMSKEEKTEGIIISVGTGKYLDNGNYQAIHLSIGEKVVFGKYAGDAIEENGKKYRILKENEVLAIVR